MCTEAQVFRVLRKVEESCYLANAIARQDGRCSATPDEQVRYAIKSGPPWCSAKKGVSISQEIAWRIALWRAFREDFDDAWCEWFASEGRVGFDFGPDGLEAALYEFELWIGQGKRVAPRFRARLQEAIVRAITLAGGTYQSVDGRTEYVVVDGKLKARLPF